MNPGESSVELSVVVPLYNEEGIVTRFHEVLDGVLAQVGRSYEVIMVNDGSTDNTLELLKQIAQKDPHVLVIDFNRNFGQTQALQAAFDRARGEIIIAMDGDLENDPTDIPMLLENLDEGYDLVNGWRQKRRDGLFLRAIPSKAANWLLRKVSGIPLQDFGSTFKAYRRDIIKDLRLYGDMHRFIPAVCHRLGARIAEVPIKHIKRPAGVSKYGLGRTFRVSLDLITLRFLLVYLTRPLHFFGKPGLWSLGLGGGILLYGLIRKIVGAIQEGGWTQYDLFDHHGPLMALGFLLVITAQLLLATGIIGEMLTRIYFEATEAPTYRVRATFGKRAEEED
jgi:glycosyltransferase involved in cell wall biosynthesis